MAAPPDIASQEPLGAHVSRKYTGTLESILEARYLRVLTTRSAFDYFIDRGRHGGYQFEMVRAFTDFLNERHPPAPGQPPIQFELLPVATDQLIPMLVEGRADMIAARMTRTEDREARLLFSIPYHVVDEVVVTHLPSNDFEFIHDLAGRSVAVRRSSSYRESLESLSRKLVAKGRSPIKIIEVNEALETEKILALVAKGHFNFTVADSIIAETAVELHSTLAILEGLALRKGGELAWAASLGASDLVEEMNAFLPRYREGSLLGNIAVKKYFQATSGLERRLKRDGTEPLSPYDDLIRSSAETHGFDWRLMAAMAYQESRFDQSAKNRWGATGLFQIKPATAREPYVGIENIEGKKNAANNVEAGIRYLAWIKKRYFDSDPDMRERDRVRLALAAYNAGPSTIIRARRRAKRMGLDPNRWFRNVELALLDMRKTEPVKYVSEINQHYLSYVMLGLPE